MSLLATLLASLLEGALSLEAPSTPPRGDAGTVPPTSIETAAEPSYPTEGLSLTAVLQQAIEHNVDLRSNAVDVAISEATIMSAVGAYDVFLNSGVTATNTKSPQRGSQAVFQTGNRSLSGFVGFTRKLETGGNLTLRIDANRSLVDQPANFIDPGLGSITIAQYRIAPTLTLTHPLLKNAGIKFNRTAIDRARLAMSQAEATQLNTAQNLIRDLVVAYWDVLFTKRDLANKKRSVEVARQQLERTSALVQAGRSSPVDAKAVEQSVAARQIDVIVAETSLLDRSLTLRTLMGQQFDERRVVGVTPTTDPGEIRPRMIDHQREIQIALQNNPQIRQLQLAMASKRIDEIEAANQRLPQLDFQGQFIPQGRSIDTIASPQRGTEAARGSWGEAFRNFFTENPRDEGRLLADYTLTGSLTLTWDIQNRTPKGNHQRVQAELRKAEMNVERIKQTVAASVIRAANSVRMTSTRMELARVSVELAQDNLSAEQARFEVGRATNFEVMQRLDQLDAAQRDALSAQVEYLKALVQLQALNSEILPAYGLELPGVRRSRETIDRSSSPVVGGVLPIKGSVARDRPKGPLPVAQHALTDRWSPAP